MISICIIVVGVSNDDGNDDYNDGNNGERGVIERGGKRGERG